MNPIWSVVSTLTAGRVFTRRKPVSSYAYLTFDDGPHPEHTPRVLELLARHEIRATFFVRGDHAKHHEEVAKRIVAAGHSIGNHSYSHPPFVSISLERQAQEMDRTEVVLTALDGRKRHLFRPPRGRPTLGTIALCLQRRYPMALWTHDSRDYALDTTAVIQRMSAVRIAPGDILLFHDDTATAAAALDVLLPRWKGAGLNFAAL
jgi:peptidoglycan/xylan/chitin deacetylase (PgdA/CDA1 family)